MTIILKETDILIPMMSKTGRIRKTGKK